LGVQCKKGRVTEQRDPAVQGPLPLGAL